MLGDINPQSVRVTSKAVVYPGRDHVVRLTVSRWTPSGAAGKYTPVDVSALTRAVLVLFDADPQIVFDSDANPGVFSFLAGGVIEADLSAFAMPQAIHNAWLVVYDADHTNGQVLVDGEDSRLQLDFRNVSTTGTTPPPGFTYVPEAPIDGETYGRKDGAWVTLEAIVSGVASVNGQTGVVTLSAADVGADAAGAAAAAVAAHEAAADPHPQYLTQAESDGRYERGLTAGANITIDRTNPDAPVISASGGGGGGAVDSVNGQAGTVVLDAADVGADAAGTAAAAVAAHEAASDPHPQYTTAAEATAAAPVQSVNGQAGTVALDTDDVPEGATNHYYPQADEDKLAGIQAGATANQPDAFLLARANHTGTQAVSTISDFNASSRAQTEAMLVAGANVTLTPGGTGATRTLTIASTGGGGGGSLVVEDEGVAVVNPATTLNFVGAGVTVTDGGAGEAVVTIPGGGAVDSVNGQTGTVVLDATDVGADPTGTAAAALAAHVAAPDPHPQYLTQAEGDSLYDQLGLAASEAEDARFQSTGLISGGQLSINAGDNTNLDIAAGVASFADYTNPQKSTALVVPFGPFTGITVPNIATANVSYIGVNSSGAVVQQTTRFTNTQRRSIVSLGAAVHSNRANLNAINTIVSANRQLLNQFGDGIRAIGQLNLSGTVYSSVGASLQMQRSAGELFSPGANFHVNPDDPHSATISAQNPVTFRYRLANGTEYADRTTIDPANYDNAGVLTAVPANRYTVQLIAVFQSGITRVQYGQVLYTQLSDAVAAAQAQSMTVEANIADNGVIRGYLAVKGDATALDNTSQAVFVTLSKFGASAAVSPLSISTTDQLAEGSTNLYFTNARVRTTLLTGLSFASTAVITAADTVLDALGKLAARLATAFDRANHTGTQTASTISDFNSAARAQVEAELVAGANITITPSGSGATRQLTIASTGGSSAILTQSVSSSSGVLDLSASTAPVILVTLTENITDITMPAGVSGQSIERRIVFTQDAANYTIPTDPADWGGIEVDGGVSIPPMGTGAGTVGIYVLANDDDAVWRLYVDQNKQSNPYATAGGTANALTLSINHVPSRYKAGGSYAQGDKVRARVLVTNTGAMTLAVDGLSAVAVKTVTGADTPAGYIRPGVDTEFTFDGTYWVAGRELEYGSNASGYFVRYANGIIDLWVEDLAIDLNTSMGAFFRGFTNWTLPASLVSTVGSTADATYNQNNDGWGGNAVANSLTNVLIRGYSATSRTGAVIDARCRGRWY